MWVVTTVKDKTNSQLICLLGLLWEAFRSSVPIVRFRSSEKSPGFSLSHRECHFWYFTKDSVISGHDQKIVELLRDPCSHGQDITTHSNMKKSTGRRSAKRRGGSSSSSEQRPTKPGGRTEAGDASHGDEQQEANHDGSTTRRPEGSKAPPT